MSGFKLLGIRTKKNLSKEFHGKDYINFFKVLEKNSFYKFYSEYDYYNNKRNKVKDSNEEVAFIKYTPSIPQEFYNRKNIDINISAVVGKNGSGKSTLLELFYISVYLLSVGKELLEYNFNSINEKLVELKKKSIRHGEKLNNLLTKFDNFTEIEELIDRIKEHLDAFDANNLEFLPQYDFLKKQIEKYKEISDSAYEQNYYWEQYDEYIEWIENTKRIINSLDLEIFYQLDNKFYMFKVGIHEEEDKFVSIRIIPEFPIEKKKEEHFEIKNVENLSEHFFYTVAVSYSHYGLNSLEEGVWLNDLFHKNDSYQTPIVINPMRTNGNIDVNKEKSLVKQRLLSNLLEPVDDSSKETLRNLTPEKKAVTLRLKFNDDKFERYRKNHELNSITDIEDIAKKLYEKYTGDSLPKLNKRVFVAMHYYIQNKIIRICKVYKRYKVFIKGDKVVDRDKLIEELIKDKSHITFKLKQAINFIRHDHIKWYSEIEFDEEISSLSKRINDIIHSENEKGKKFTVIEFLPPSIFDVKIELENGSLFEKMSSGEKQKIYTISSIVYHLINLNSVFNNNDNDSKGKLLKYKYVNILFDEIEQYFHPEMQRAFINDMLDYIEKMNELNRNYIKGINILFATHSPFILSDIPHQNVLKLDGGKIIENEQLTFGANIHELLADSFFMKTLVGKFAEKKILELIGDINDGLNDKSHNKLIELIGDSFLKESILQYIKQKNDQN